MTFNIVFERNKGTDKYEKKILAADIPEILEEDGWEPGRIFMKGPEIENTSSAPLKFKLPNYPGSAKLVRKDGKIWIARRTKNQEICPDCVLINDSVKNRFWKNSLCLGPKIYGYDESINSYWYNRWSQEIDVLFKEQQLLATS